MGDDGLIAEEVGPWAKTKLQIVRSYIGIASATRRKYEAPGAAYIDVFCGPGRSRITTTGEFIDGSPVCSFKAGRDARSPFSSIEISDKNGEFLDAAEKRLSTIAAPVRRAQGPAGPAVRTIVDRLDRYGLHFALLDPHNLSTLSFALFEELAKLNRVDVIAHISIADIRRNIGLYETEGRDELDTFAPGWRTKVDLRMSKEAVRSAIIEYWFSQIEKVLPRSLHHELIRADGNQPLYWLIFLSRADLAHRFWNTITSAAKSPMLL